jgi:hypothetical protein
MDLQGLIDGSLSLSKNSHLKYDSFFKARGYTQIIPYQSESAPRELVDDFNCAKSHSNVSNTRQ